MSRIVYVNGLYVPEDEAKVSVFDRAFLFGDAVYEVTAVLGGRLVDFEPHLARLDRSLRGDRSCRAAQLKRLCARCMWSSSRRNALDEGIVYLEITRGAADRDFAYPEPPCPTWSPSPKAGR